MRDPSASPDQTQRPGSGSPHPQPLPARPATSTPSPDRVYEPRSGTGRERVERHAQLLFPQVNHVDGAARAHLLRLIRRPVRPQYPRSSTTHHRRVTAHEQFKRAGPCSAARLGSSSRAKPSGRLDPAPPGRSGDQAVSGRPSGRAESGGSGDQAESGGRAASGGPSNQAMSGGSGGRAKSGQSGDRAAS